jgi:HEAT repeat protein
LDYAAASEAPLRLALWVGAVAATLTAAMLLYMLVLRARNARRERLRKEVAARWRPLLMMAAVQGVPPLPPLLPPERWAFALLWQQIVEGVRGQAREPLCAVLREVGMAPVARRWLSHAGPTRRVMALAMLGHLGDPADWEAIRPHLDERRPDLSLTAARALVLLDARRAVHDIVAHLLKRHDWPVSRVASLLGEAGPAYAHAPVLGVVQLAGEADLLRLLPLLSVLDEQQAASAVTALLQRVQDPQVLAAALAKVKTPAALPAVRELAEHAAWNVRAEAASALARIGTPADRPTLQRLMADPQWWVRYHATRAMVAMPGTTPAALQRLRDDLNDRFARDMLRQVMAEQVLQ